jgi:hypothetical protein
MSHLIENAKEISINLLDANGETKKSGIRGYRDSNKTENGLELFFLLDENRKLAFAPEDIIESEGKRFYIKGMFLNCPIAMGNHHHIEAGDAKTMFIEDFLNSGDETGKFPYTIVARFPKHELPEIVIALYSDEDSASQTFTRLDPDEARMRERRATTAQYVLVYRGQDLRIRDILL